MQVNEKKEGAVTERPILFSGPMVRAILEGRKTVTRRAIKSDWIQSERAPIQVAPGAFHFWCSGEHSCPYGMPGDRLWLRESLQYDSECGHYYAAGGAHGETVYLSSLFDDDAAQTGYSYDGRLPERSVPSIHLPRRYSRILLEITDVSVERLHAITYEHAAAEGVHRDEHRMWYATEDGGIAHRYPQGAFRDLWESINGPGSWDANPWVWAVEFKRVEVAHG